MSGGVDSSVTAGFLKQAGYEVTGVYFDLFKKDEQDWEMARRVGEKLGVKVRKLNFRKEFKTKVIDCFLKSYQKGQVPNPCVLCNPNIKFGAFWRWAKKQGASYISTRHYARIVRKKENFKLLKGKDEQKDQSYFLYRLKQKDLKHILFPLGDYTKKEVIKLARKWKLPSAEKPSSQDVCFMKGRSLKDFLPGALKPGEIREAKTRKILGEHQGVFFFTPGQRTGLKLGGGPWYVIKKDVKKNIVYVSKDKEGVFNRELVCGKISWVNGDGIKSPLKVKAKIRYRSELYPAVIHPAEKNGNLKVVFKTPQHAITPGQSAVFYKGEEVLGGGIIKS